MILIEQCIFHYPVQYKLLSIHVHHARMQYLHELSSMGYFTKIHMHTWWNMWETHQKVAKGECVFKYVGVCGYGLEVGWRMGQNLTICIAMHLVNVPGSNMYVHEARVCHIASCSLRNSGVCWEQPGVRREPTSSSA